MASLRLRYVPSVRLILLLVGIALLAPMGVIGWDSWRSADAEYDAAQAAAAHADTSLALLQLAPAVGLERNALAVKLAAVELIDVIPPSALVSMGIDYENDLLAAEATVDDLLTAADDIPGAIELHDSRTALRDRLDEGTIPLADAVNRYDTWLQDLDTAIAQELASLASSSAAAGAPDLVDSVGTAEALSSVQLIGERRFIQWTEVRPPIGSEPFESFEALGTSLTLLETYRTDLDNLTDSSTETGRLWNALRSSQTAAELDLIYSDSLRAAVAAGSDPIGDAVDLADVDAQVLLALAADVQRIQVISVTESEQIAEVVSSGIADIEEAADAVVSHAETTRLRTAGLVLGFALVLVASALLVIALVIRPAGRMSEAAQALRSGRLNTRMAETGPKELRAASHAMNEAIIALETAEAQAVALAEERLDDPVLSKPSIGRLGESLQSAVSHLATSLNEREGFQRRLAHEASHDGLTKLPNRNAVLVSLEAAMARTRRSSAALALLFIDIDDFKMINDVHGHQAGDTVLRTISHRLTAAIRQGDLAGRLGGDEFVVIAEPVENIDDALLLSERVLTTVCQPIDCDGLIITPSISIGIGIADGDDLSADELLRDADLAVYRAKSLGKGRVDVCDEELRSEMTQRTTLEQSIQTAIANDELMLQFQPVMDTATEQVTSLEALVRWKRADGELVPPDEFIPMAERTDLILEIDRWVLRNAVQQLARWTDHQTLGSLPVAVNISARHLASGQLGDHVQQVLADHGVDPTRIVLELTETALLCDIGGAAQELAKLRHTGVRIALDDFGTGYMSLSRLRGLPVDVIKIDRSFVSKIESGAERSLIELIVDTGHVLGATITAEGVETNSQAQILAEFGSDHLQGYLFSKPIDAELLERWVDTTTHTRSLSG